MQSFNSNFTHLILPKPVFVLIYDILSNERTCFKSFSLLLGCFNALAIAILPSSSMPQYVMLIKWVSVFFNVNEELTLTWPTCCLDAWARLQSTWRQNLQCIRCARGYMCGVSSTRCEYEFSPQTVQMVILVHHCSSDWGASLISNRDIHETVRWIVSAREREREVAAHTSKLQYDCLCASAPWINEQRQRYQSRYSRSCISGELVPLIAVLKKTKLNLLQRVQFVWLEHQCVSKRFKFNRRSAGMQSTTAVRG